MHFVSFHNLIISPFWIFVQYEDGRIIYRGTTRTTKKYFCLFSRNSSISFMAECHQNVFSLACGLYIQPSEVS